MNRKWQALLFIGFWAAIAIGSHFEEKSPEGQARIDATWEAATKDLASENGCDSLQELRNPDACAQIRKDAERDAAKRLSAYR